ncbi:S1C family serine protease [Nocardia puris]|uniref:S1-C subfamily serine protease n=1 Tax=Nocardia puris TaxID=208602 RepID=A0A366DYV9_9NOCA|nr:trypsin-like peptidase domain-containing protein [Nocardia puris]RBO94454.1 S1-C subfamily serine protease [Nocardia puris]
MSARDEVVGVDEVERDAYSRAVIGVAAEVAPRVARVRLRRTEGSAVVWADGVLVTTAHVAGVETSGDVLFADGSESRFELIGIEPVSDLAVLRVRDGSPDAATFGDADGLDVGQVVVAVGSPLSPGAYVSAGVVGALGRALPVTSRRAGRLLESVIQTDTTPNPVDAGGALCDSAGRVIGILTTVTGIGTGLAIPVDPTTRHIIDTLRTEGRVRRAYLGLIGIPAPLPTGGGGVRVFDVVRGGPAERAGLRRGDVVLDIGGAKVEDAQSLQRLLFADAIGHPTPITLLRGGEPTEVTAVPIELGAD